MTQRYFVESAIEKETVELKGPEAQHLIRVMRVRRGEEVTLFDGSGGEFSATVTEVERSVVRLRIVRRELVDRELPFSLRMGVALPKGERQRWLIEKLTELGVTQLIPLVTERGIVQPDSGTVLRLRRAVVEASKQCGRNRLMDIAPPQPWFEFLRVPGDALCVLAHPRSPAVDAGSAMPLRDKRGVVAAVGPEGGFTEEEVSAALSVGWQMLDLGPRILRIETAAVAIAAAFALQ
jgi:16S rRNA (uracil1498-N3)-methyltransferase